MQDGLGSPKHYGDLPLRKGRSGPGGYQEYDYVGTKSLGWSDLERLCDTFMASADASELWGGGIVNVKGAPTAPEARNCNGLSMEFHDERRSNGFFSDRSLLTWKGFRCTSLSEVNSISGNARSIPR